MKTEEQVSAGGVVVRGHEVLLIAVGKAGVWRLPKGQIEAGETAEQAALREIREETGVSAEIVAPLPDIDYTFVTRGVRRIHKRVLYFLSSYRSGDPADHDRREVSDARFMPWSEAIARLTFDNERKVVQRAREIVAGGRAI